MTVGIGNMLTTGIKATNSSLSVDGGAARRRQGQRPLRSSPAKGASASRQTAPATLPPLGAQSTFLLLHQRCSGGKVLLLSHRESNKEVTSAVVYGIINRIGGASMAVKISGMMGTGSMGHNNRKFITENVDPARTEQNITLRRENLKQVYHELFDEALAEYNAKKTKTRDKIPDYYRHIEKSKQERLFHEVIFQIGNKDNCGCETPEGERAAAALKEFAEAFQERNPHLRVFNSVIHMDEATPHIHRFRACGNGAEAGACKTSVSETGVGAAGIYRPVKTADRMECLGKQ